MSPELIKAIKDRIVGGQSKEEIKTAVLAMGYTEALFEAAYTLALHDMHGVAPIKEEAFPTATQLVMQGWQFLTTHRAVLWVLLVPALLSGVLQWVSTTYAALPGVSAAADGLDFAAAIAYMVGALAVLYIISTDGTASLTTAFSWVGKRIYGFLWVSLLSVLVVWGGLAFFIIPGLVILVMISLSQYAFALEERRGMDALLRSRELIKGRFWKISYVVSKVWLLLFIPLILGLIVFVTVGVVAEVGSRPYDALLGNILLEAFMVVVNVISMHALLQLYRVLQASSSEGTSASVKLRYWFLVWYGIALLIVVGVVVAFKFSATELYKEIPAVTDSTAIQNEIRGTTLIAKEYMLAHNQSYEGVCEVLRPHLSVGEGVECNDGEQSWAISVNVGDEYWCADTQTVLKKVQTELADKTSCLALP